MPTTRPCSVCESALALAWHALQASADPEAAARVHHGSWRNVDTTMAVAESLYEEFKEPLYAPPPLLSRMVDAGLLGRKSGRGFHVYDA